MAKDRLYISGKESARIARENAQAIRQIKQKRAAFTEADYITTMRDPSNIVEFDDLHTYFYTDAGVLKAVHGVSFDIPEGATIGIVGESGCGKSVTSLSLMQLVQAPQGQIASGAIRFKALGENAREIVYDVAKLPTSMMSTIRGSQISMIFQEPMTSLNPIFTIGYQLDEVSKLHLKFDKPKAKERSIEMLELVGMSSPERVYKSYPHQLSGGMRQRVMIAMSLCCNPRLIIADEPTTALDVTIQAQILELLRSVKQKISGSIMLITHDLGVIAEMADYVVIMYAGRIVEKGTLHDIFKNPRHPYTIGLQKSKPIMNREVDRLYSIPGNVLSPIDLPDTCYFGGRCEARCERCSGAYPPMVALSPTHSVACWLAAEEGEK